MMISGSPGYPADFQWQLIPKCQLQGIKLNYCMFPLLEDGDIRYIREIHTNYNCSNSVLSNVRLETRGFRFLLEMNVTPCVW